MNKSQNINLEEKYLQMVQNILSSNLKETLTKAYIFGSRIGDKKVKKFSDIDIALEDIKGDKLDLSLIFHLKDAFENSDLPYKVDILDINDIAESFKSKIVEQMQEILF